MQPQEIEKRNVMVCLPNLIYSNVQNMFKVFLDKIMVDLLNTETADE